jgi:hypothetical protein
VPLLTCGATYYTLGGKAERGMSAALHTIESWCWYGLIVLGYIWTGGALFGEPYGPASSGCAVLHATTLLFLTLWAPWQALGRLAVVLFVGAALKIDFYDMADFSAVEKSWRSCSLAASCWAPPTGFNAYETVLRSVRNTVLALSAYPPIRLFGSRGH